MKTKKMYLAEYTEAETTKLFEETGMFFAFNDEQFKEGFEKAKAVCTQRSENGKISIVNCGRGGYCPKEHLDTMLDGMADITKRAMAEQIKDHGMEAIVKRELDNHECYYTGDPTDAINYLVGTGYPVTEEQVEKIFHNRNYKLA
jgi:hypothetical protein